MMYLIQPHGRVTHKWNGPQNAPKHAAIAIANCGKRLADVKVLRSRPSGPPVCRRCATTKRQRSYYEAGA